MQREEEKAAAPPVEATETAEKAEAKPTTEKHYSLESGVTLSANVEKKVGEIADKYYAKNKKNLVVTSGTRTAASQAEAMYTKLKGGDNLAVYKDQKSAQAIKKAYDDAVAAKKSKDEIVAAMTTVIEEQIKNGVYISNHLRAGAVDIRNKDMTADDKDKFKDAAKEAGITPLEEDTPPHFHLQID